MSHREGGGQSWDKRLLHSESGIRERGLDYLLAAATGVLALGLYAATVQRTLSFWDCGEFIACSAILGLPHPPGSTLFVLLGRLMAHCPWPTDMGFRVNLVSVICGALAVSLGYLIVVRLVRRYLFPSSPFWGREWLLFVCGSTGAMLLGFGSTAWTNATEAEVYGLTLLLFLLVLYLGVIWHDARSTSYGPRLLILATYLAVLGLGVHMMVYLALPAIWLSVLLVRDELSKDWRVWVAAFAILSVTFAGVEAFLWNLGLVLLVGLWFQWSPPRLRERLSFFIVPIMSVILYGLFAFTLPLQDPAPSPALSGSLGSFVTSFGWTSTDWLAVGAVWLACVIGAYSASRGKVSLEARRWALPVGLVLATLLAFSFTAFIPVRSRQNPTIDENDPETWVGVKGFLERKQYGRESMIERMFHRRGDWSHQVGRHPRMGFWSFFETQYGLKSGPIEPASGPAYRLPAFLLLFALGLWGVLSLVWLKPHVGWPLLCALVLSTIGLVVYMNFADGTRYNLRAADQAYLEVRDRDYFFTTGFALFGLCVGLGVASFLRTFLEPRSKFHRPVVGVASVVLLLSLPFKTVAANYWTHDRSRDVVSYEYARNMLESCGPDAVLFTSGDNDTFPLWCLQEGYGIRRDVRIVNLSLANTLWYIHQAVELGHVPMGLSSHQIDLLRPDARAGRIQDQVINAVLESNRERVPIYFGSSTPEGSRVFHGAPLDSHLVMEGLVMRLSDSSGYRMVNNALVLKRYQGEYRLAGLSDSSLYLDEATSRIADNYASSLLFVADACRLRHQVDSAMMAAALAARLRPGLAPAKNYLVQLAGEYDRRSVLDSMVAAAKPEAVGDLYVHYGLAAEYSADSLRAMWAYRQALATTPDLETAFQRLVALQFGRQEWDSLLVVIDSWIKIHPADTIAPKLRAAALLSQRSQDSAAGAP